MKQNRYTSKLDTSIDSDYIAVFSVSMHPYTSTHYDDDNGCSVVTNVIIL